MHTSTLRAFDLRTHFQWHVTKASGTCIDTVELPLKLEENCEFYLEDDEAEDDEKELL